jgi:hypothetical protein
VRVVITTELPISPPLAWELVQSPALMRHVSWPLTVFTPLDPPAWPRRWSPGQYRVRMRALGVLPIGEQTISISFPLEEPGEGRYQVRDDGSGQLVRRWDHLITFEPGDTRAIGHGKATRYTDQVDIEAGFLTVPVWLWANVLYRWRQRRWRRLVRRRPTADAR